MKSIFATSIAALALLPGAAFAGPYVNVESNSGFVGEDYSATVIDNHIGYEGKSWYIQGGPAIVAGDGVDAEVELSGKVGASVAVSDSVDVYGELSAITGEEISYGAKVGAKFKF